MTTTSKMTKHFTWTSAIVLKIGKFRISLHEGGVVRVRRKKVSLPYFKVNVLSILNEGFGDIVVRTVIGIKITWRKVDDKLEIHIPRAFEGRLCGLCGDFNGSAEDDLRGPDGTLYADGSSLAHAWIKGGGGKGRRARRRNERRRNNGKKNKSEEKIDRLNDGTENDDGSQFDPQRSISYNPYNSHSRTSSSSTPSFRPPNRRDTCHNGPGSRSSADSVVRFQSPCRGGDFADVILSHRRCGFFKHPDLRVCRRLVDPVPYRNACVRDVCRCRKNYLHEEVEEKNGEDDDGKRKTQKKRFASSTSSSSSSSFFAAGSNDFCACKSAASYLRRCVLEMAEEKRRIAAEEWRRRIDLHHLMGGRRGGAGGGRQRWSPYDLGKIMTATGCKINKYTLGFS